MVVRTCDDAGMDDLTIRPADPADMEWLIHIMYDDPPGDMRAIEPDVRKATAIGAIVMRAGIEVDAARHGGRPG